MGTHGYSWRIKWSHRHRADPPRGRLELKPCLQRTGLLSVTLQLNLDKGLKKLTQLGTALSLPCKVFFHFLCNACPYSCVLALLISVVKATCCNCLKINQQLLKLPSTQVEKYCKPQGLKRFVFFSCTTASAHNKAVFRLPPPGKIYTMKWKGVQTHLSSRDFAREILHGVMFVHGEVVLDIATSRLTIITDLHSQSHSCYALWEGAMMQSRKFKCWFIPSEVITESSFGSNTFGRAS